MEFISVFNLIIAVQAFFLSGHFLLKKKAAKTINYTIAFLCFSFAIVTLNTYFHLLSPPIRSILFQDISNNLMWFIGPCFYLYTVYQNEKPNRKFIILNSVPYLIPTTIEIFFEWNWFSQYIMFAGFIQMSIYLFLTIRFSIKNYEKYRNYYHWILPSVSAFSVIVVFNFTLHLLMANGIFLMPDAIRLSCTSLLAFPIFFLAYKEMNSTNDFGIRPKKYQTTHLSEKDVDAHMMRIEKAMVKDEIYLQKTLTFQKFADQIQIKPKYISQAINQKKEMSFSDYILQFRLAKVKAELVKPENKNLTIFGIAQDCGFNSNSRFSLLFKQHTGLTARQFQQKFSS